MTEQAEPLREAFPAGRSDDGAAERPVPGSAPLADDRPREPVGPGIAESILWILAFFVFEIAGTVLWGAALAVLHFAAHGGTFDQAKYSALFEELTPWMIGAVKALEVLAALVAIRLRFGRDAFRLTGFRPIPAPHFVILVFAVLPAAVLSGQCYALLQSVWEPLTQRVDFLDSLDQMSSIESVQKLARATPLAVLVMAVAVMPALNEEFLFRALIGRGLLARYGLVAGITFTSIFFAAVHLSPVHAAALLPLAVLLHVGYLSSGSIWSCVFVHFANNALSVVLMKLAALQPGIADVTDTKFSPLLFSASAACVVASIWLLLRMQVRWHLPATAEWRPSVPGIERPPGNGVTRVIPDLPTLPLATTVLCYTGFPIAVAVGASLGLL